MIQLWAFRCVLCSIEHQTLYSFAILEILSLSLIISIILTTGVFITGVVDERQFKKFGFIGARFLTLSYTFIYSFINIFILVHLYSKYIYDSHGLIISAFVVLISLVCIGIVHTDTENSIIEYFYDRSSLKKFLIRFEGKDYDKQPNTLISFRLKKALKKIFGFFLHHS